MAHSMDEGQCMSAADFKAQRLAEGQNIIALANQEVDGPVSKVGVIFIADHDGGTGYVVQSDKPFKEAAGQLCISDKIYNVHVNFAKVAPLPLIEGSDPLIAKQECDSLVSQGHVSEGGCQTLDTVISTNLKSGGRPLMWGTQANGLKYTLLANVSEEGQPAGNPAGSGASVFSTLAGATTLARPLVDTMLNPDAFKDMLQ